MNFEIHMMILFSIKPNHFLSSELYILDCRCSNNLEFSSSCMSATAQDESIGEYAHVCTRSDDTKVYQHTSNNLYLYYDSEV